MYNMTSMTWVIIAILFLCLGMASTSCHMFLTNERLDKIEKQLNIK